MSKLAKNPLSAAQRNSRKRMLGPCLEVVRVSLPDEGFVLEKTVLALYPVGRTTWWQGVRDGRFPKPCRLSARRVGWRVSDIRRLLSETLSTGEVA